MSILTIDYGLIPIVLVENRRGIRCIDGVETSEGEYYDIIQVADEFYAMKECV